VSASAIDRSYQDAGPAPPRSESDHSIELSPRLVSQAQGLRSDDHGTVLMAHALGWLARMVPTSLALFYTVDGRTLKFTGDVIAAGTMHAPAFDLEWHLRRYRERYHAVDPFAPRRFAGSGVSVVDLAELDGVQPACSPYVGDYLRALGVCGQTTVFLRRKGRIIAGVDLLRTPEDPELGAHHISLVRGTHALLEHAYVCATGAPTAAGHKPAVVSLALSRRELEVARLVADGASNTEVALALAISVATVKKHLIHVFEKLHVRSRSQLGAVLRADYDREPAAS
jgi:DNA-binding CsgD family transcriptional regulator